jgi:hypothetical protein
LRKVTPVSQSKGKLSLILDEYQRNTDRISDTNLNWGIHGRVNTALVAAGSQQEVEAFEDLARSSLSIRRRSSDRSLEMFGTRTPLSLRSLMRALRPSRPQLRRRLPRERHVEAVSRLETIEGRVRLEWRFGLSGAVHPLEELLREFVRERDEFLFVLATIRKDFTGAKSSLISSAGVWWHRFPMERCKRVLRREQRFWRNSETIALDEATSATLKMSAAHWDKYLADPTNRPTRSGR